MAHPRFRPAALLRRLVPDRTGNMLALAAASIFVIAAMVGGAIDMAFSWKAQNRLQNACDSAALAGRRGVTTNGYDATAQAQARSYFNANYIDAQQGTSGTAFSSSSPDNGITVNGTASTTVPLRIMPLFGRNTMAITVTCQTIMGVGNMDVTFVLDTTGSMGDTPTGFTTTKIVALQNAMKNFYTTLASATQNTSARVRYAFVPYSSSINVGRLITTQNPAWIVSTYAIQSRLPRFETTITQKFSNSGGTYVTKSAEVYNATPNGTPYQASVTAYASQAVCVAAIPADTAWTNFGIATTQATTTNINGSNVATTITKQPQTSVSSTCQRSGDSYYLWSYVASRSYNTYAYAGYTNVTGTASSSAFDHYDYKLVAYDTSTYKTFAATNIPTGTNGANVSSTWAGCIEERSTTATASFGNSGTAITPAAATDLDIDSAPGSGDPSKWAPMWPEAYYLRTVTINGGVYVNSAVVSTQGQQTYSFCPAPSQLLASMTQTAFNAYVDTLTPAGATYHDFGMLWGARVSSPSGIFASNVTAAPPNGQNVGRHLIFMTDGIPEANALIQQAYGIEWHDHRITADGYTDDNTRHTSRFQALCAAVKARGIRIWVIGFTTALDSNLSSCASPSSSFTANDSAGLDSAFQSIAKQVGELRITG